MNFKVVKKKLLDNFTKFFFHSVGSKHPPPTHHSTTTEFHWFPSLLGKMRHHLYMYICITGWVFSQKRGSPVLGNYVLCSAPTRGFLFLWIIKLFNSWKSQEMTGVFLCLLVLERVGGSFRRKRCYLLCVCVCWHYCVKSTFLALSEGYDEHW